ncbi:MAG: amidohydrolase [Streptosporangiaceae bacterium]
MTSEADVEIFTARRVVTMSPGSEGADAVAVANGRVAAVGSADDLAARFPSATRTDLGGSVVVPGFNDAHMHLVQAAEDVLHLDLSYRAVHSIGEIKDKVSEQARQTPPGGWIRGSRYDDGKTAESRTLTCLDLDEAAPEHPVLVIHVAGHWGVASSAALRVGGIDEGTPGPDGGGYGRDGAGRLNGVLYEQALFDFAYPQVAHTEHTVVPPSTMEDKLVGLRRAVQMFHAAGLTSIGDALVGPDDVLLLTEARRRGLLSLRVNMLVTAEHYDQLSRLGASEEVGDERLRIGGVKTFVDGAIGGRTCLLEEPFEGTDDYGIQSRSTGQLREIIRRAQEDGVRVGVHANGDRAIGILLDLFEEAERELPRPDLHHRIEHCTVVTEDIVRRMRRLGAVAVPFGSYVNYHGGRLLDWYGPKRLERMFAHRWFLDAGICVAGSSDFLCGPYEPLLALQSCVTRQGFDGPVMGENQRITPLEALACYTTNAARAAGEQAYKGRLEPGYLADFVVLGGDPLTSDPAALGALPVEATYVGARRVWSAT